MQTVEGAITSIGVMAGTLLIKPNNWLDVMVRVSEAQKQKMLPRLNVGDRVSVNYDETTGQIKGGINILKQNENQVKPQYSYPTEKEQVILAEGDKQNHILWQSCMKIAVEVEKFYAVGGAEDRDETCKNVIKMTNNLYEASQRKMRGVPPIPEVGPQ